MKISSKGRYALRTMADIATHGGEFVPISEISMRQDISQKYLESIIALLVKGGLLESMRGASGGYKLKIPADKCTVKQILEITGDTPNFVTCANEGDCPKIDSCAAAGCWTTLTHMINDYLNSVTLNDLITKNYKK